VCGACSARVVAENFGGARAGVLPLWWESVRCLVALGPVGVWGFWALGAFRVMLACSRKLRVACVVVDACSRPDSPLFGS
jgi:hypothetical protein